MGNRRVTKRFIKIVKRLFVGKEQSPPFKIEGANITCGRESYHNGNFAAKGRGRVTIGKFCAFGENVKLILSNHNYNYPSIQYTLYGRLFNELPYEKKAGAITVGHDVWIGDNVIILPDVTIGNGACIGAGTIVTKDIPDYAIAGGNPAKIIKYRFTQNQIDRLNETKWWDWDDAAILQNRAFFFSTPAE